MTRDFVKEMRALIDAETAGGEYFVGTTAERIVAKLQVTDPELLDGWLRMQAESIVRAAINARDQSVRGYARAHAGRAVFAEATAQHEQGNREPLTGWLQAAYTIDTGARKPLGRMTKQEVLYVADSFEKRQAANGLRAALLRAIASQLTRNKTVEQKFTNEEIDRLWNSLE